MIASAFSVHKDNPIGADGRTRRQREADEANAVYEAQRDEECRIQAERMIWGNDKISAVTRKEKTPSHSVTSTIETCGPSSRESKAAASALSSKPQNQLPRFAAPTAATRAKSAKVALPPVSAASPRALQISRTTIGYSKGRKVSATLRSPAAQSPKNEDQSDKNHVEGVDGETRGENKIMAKSVRNSDHRLREGGDSDDESLADEGCEGFQLPWEEQDDAFQLDPAMFQF